LPAYVQREFYDYSEISPTVVGRLVDPITTV
jgi:hypothetical protein